MQIFSSKTQHGFKFGTMARWCNGEIWVVGWRCQSEPKIAGSKRRDTFHSQMSLPRVTVVIAKVEQFTMSDVEMWQFHCQMSLTMCDSSHCQLSLPKWDSSHSQMSKCDSFIARCYCRKVTVSLPDVIAEVWQFSLPDINVKVWQFSLLDVNAKMWQFSMSDVIAKVWQFLLPVVNVKVWQFSLLDVIANA